MSHLDEWVHLIANQLRSEAERIGVQARSELYQDAARETFVRVVLEPFLPGNFSVGSGKIIDAAGKISSPQDIIIYRSDYPQFNLPGSHDVFIYESVLATIQVCSKLIRKSFFNAMDQCASIGELNPVIEPAIRRAIAEKMKMQLDAHQQYVHPDPLITGRYHLIGRPQSFIYAFTGYQTSEKQLAENLGKWIDAYHEHHDALQMKSLPSVIATQGCFAWRNSAPFTIKQRALMGVGNDTAPLRLIILQLMHALNRRLQHTTDGYGIKSTIAPYLASFKRPSIKEMVGAALNPGDNKPAIEKEPQQITEKVATAPQPVGTNAGIKSVETTTDSAPARPQQPLPAQQPAQTAEFTAQPGTPDQTDSKGNEPLIQDLSSPWPNRTSANKDGQQPKSPVSSTVPLSFYATSEDTDVGDYQFDPVEPETPRHEETDEDQSSQTHDSAFLETQVIDTRKTDQNNSKIDEDNSFADTLVETPDSMKKKLAEPAPAKPEYVSESLI